MIADTALLGPKHLLAYAIVIVLIIVIAAMWSRGRRA